MRQPLKQRHMTYLKLPDMICKVALAPTCSYWTQLSSFDYKGTWVRLSMTALEQFCLRGREQWVTSLLPLSVYKRLRMDIFSLLRWKGRRHFTAERVVFSWNIQEGALRIWSSSRRNSSGNALFFCCTFSYHVPQDGLPLGSVFLGFISLQSSSTGACNVALGNNTNDMEDLLQQCCQAQSEQHSSNRL